MVGEPISEPANKPTELVNAIAATTRVYPTHDLVVLPSSWIPPLLMCGCCPCPDRSTHAVLGLAPPHSVLPREI